MQLRDLQDLLEKEEFSTTLLPASKDSFNEKLILFLGLDHFDRERVAEITLHQQIRSLEVSETVQEQIPPQLHFLAELPFKVEDLALSQVASLLFFINPLLDIPGFYLDELEGKVYYRVVHLADPTVPLHKSILLTLIGSLMLNLNLFASTIESLATGEVTFNDLLKQLTEAKNKK